MRSAFIVLPERRPRVQLSRSISRYESQCSSSLPRRIEGSIQRVEDNCEMVIV
jgi:hypothetical protein